MHAGLNIAGSQPFQLLAGLQQQAAVRDPHRDASPVRQPDVKAREPRLAVDGLQGATGSSVLSAAAPI